MIGIRNAAMLSQRFRGASLYVPHARKALCLHYHSIGWSVRAISELLQISPNGVRKNLYRA
ncbi:MAG: sigma-70 family RNA polymerase sigma factor [Gammaproteobacteria bacterium]|nr:sigma-70 family RNA polymerase sigma factor [Gammaproteobacteria bacterium]